MSPFIPSQIERERSHELQELIRTEMTASQGTITFERYMELCLYADELGYYACGQSIFGEQGDFVTSSELDDSFAKAFADHLISIKSQLPSYSLIEIGAGSGRFAAQLLTELKKQNHLPLRYYIVETSAALRKAQQEYLEATLEDEASLLKWALNFTQPISCAVVVANEVIDALPVRLLSVHKGEIFERCIQWSKQRRFEFVCTPADEWLKELTQSLLLDRQIWQLQQSYETEICVRLPSFIQQITSFVDQGILFFVDYGYPRSEYYHVQRNMGTLLCHYRHRAQENPLIWPGLQDISCNVDFTAIVEAGTQAGLCLESYSTQAQFMLASNFIKKLEGELQNSSSLKQLMLPGAMGERFQVMVFSKQLSIAHQFATRDLSHRL